MLADIDKASEAPGGSQKYPCVVDEWHRRNILGGTEYPGGLSRAQEGGGEQAE